MKIADGIGYIGVNDHKIDLFEGQYVVPNGMAYNSYVVKGEKIAVMDTVDVKFGDEWVEKLEIALDGAKPGYIVVQHMEPDHSANLVRFAEKYPEAKIVASSKAFPMMKCLFGTDFEDRKIVVGDGDRLELGGKTLVFAAAPMVHWPEVIVTYEETTKTLFTADGFGKFGALDAEEDWACEARRYYFGIVGKYGMQVQALLKKVNALDVERICPLHGPVLSENLAYYINLYNIWSSYGTESEGVMIAFTSVYGNTRAAVEELKKELEKNGCKKVAVADLARDDMAEAVEDAFRYGKLVMATTTYNADIFPFMKTFIEALGERNYQNKTIAFMENGLWAPIAAKTMKTMTEKFKNITYAETTVKLKGKMTETNKKEIIGLAKELCLGYNSNKE